MVGTSRHLGRPERLREMQPGDAHHPPPGSISTDAQLHTLPGNQTYQRLLRRVTDTQNMLHKHLLGGVTGIMIMEEGSANQQDKGL